MIHHLGVLWGVLVWLVVATFLVGILTSGARGSKVDELTRDEVERLRRMIRDPRTWSQRSGGDGV